MNVLGGRGGGGGSTFEELLVLSAVDSTQPLPNAFFVPRTAMHYDQ